MSDTPIAKMSNGRRVSWPVETWPEKDRLAWQRANTVGDFMDDDGEAAGWRPATHRALVGTYGRWLHHLDRTGLLDLDAAPSGRVTPEAIASYVRSLRAAGCAPVTIASYVAQLSMMVQALAPNHSWSWLREAQAKLQRRASPSRNKRPLLKPITELIALGADLMAAADAEVVQNGMVLSAAINFRDGLMIELLARRQLRRRNFVSIEIGRHLTADGDGGYDLRFGVEETKGRHALEYRFPESLLPALHRYLNVYRPFLVGLRSTRGQSRQGTWPQAGTRLWVNQYGSPLGEEFFTEMVKDRTRARFGQALNPHLFRDCAATDIAAHDPANARIAASVLGHSDFTTTEAHYIHAQANLARAAYHDEILSIRKLASSDKRRAVAGRAA